MSVTTPNSATPVPPGMLVGRWVIQDQIGAGGTANVYRARPAAGTLDGERPEVAIRICRPVDRRHLDAIIATYEASPSHPNVLAVDSVFPINLGGIDHVACVTEVGVRGTLEDRISQAPLDQIEARSLADDLLNGLDAYHRAGMVHGDVKPSNIMRFESGWKLADPAATETDETNLGTSTVLSHERTLRYVAPEALDARGKTKRSSDVWAFGVTLNEAVAGSPPFSSMVDQVTYNYQPSPTLGPELQHLVDASLAPPERRCATAADLMAERVDPKEPSRPLAQRTATGSGVLLLAVAVAVVLAAGAAFVATRGGEQTEPSSAEQAEPELTTQPTNTGSTTSGSGTTDPPASTSSATDSAGLESTISETTDAEVVASSPAVTNPTDSTPSSTSPSGTAPSRTTQPGPSTKTIALDFSEKQIATWFDNPYGSDGISVADDGGGSVLDINALNIDRPLLLRSEANGDPLIGGTHVEMEADFRISYFTSREYGARAPSHGFALKTLAATNDRFNNPNPNAYTVAVSPHPDGISVWMGVGRDLEAEPLGYNQLGSEEGHTNPTTTLVFPMKFDLTDQTIELGYWHLRASLDAKPDDDGGWRVELAATLTNPDGEKQSLTWVDDGPSAFGGPGRVGLVNFGVWSTTNRYDNLKVSVR